MELNEVWATVALVVAAAITTILPVIGAAAEKF